MLPENRFSLYFEKNVEKHSQLYCSVNLFKKLTKDGLKKEHLVMRIVSLFLHAVGEGSNKRRNIRVGKFSGDNVCAVYLLHYIIHQNEF